MSEQQLSGLGASPGIAIGPVFRYEKQRLRAEKVHVDDPAAERAALQAALEQAASELEALRARTAQDAGAEEAAIFEAQGLFLEDPELLQQVRTLIDEERVSAAYAWDQGSHFYAQMLRDLDDPYLAQRAMDVEDVAQRVLAILQGEDRGDVRLSQPAVIVAQDLAPSDTVSLQKEMVLAFCTAEGGPTSHAAILAKALGVPAVVGLGSDLLALESGAQVIVDGDAGVLLPDPDEDDLQQYARRRRALSSLRSEAEARTREPAVTRDGVAVEVVANVANLADAQQALEYGAEGIGLLRTEFLFLNRAEAPLEEEQVAAYRAILQVMEQRPVIVRTLDIGGDKPAPYLDLPAEDNPFLGRRGIRLTLHLTELFETQLRALLRAGRGHNLKIMFPMVGSLAELQRAQGHLQAAREQLEARGEPYAEALEVGIMIEVPSAALIAGVLAQQVDFFSIGTNDLTQYTMAAARTNATVADLASPFHPAALRLMQMTIDAAHEQGRWVGLCGEFAGNPLAAPLLLGLGLDEFSMSPRSIPLVKESLRRLSSERARDIARQALGLPDAGEVEAYLESVQEEG
ncbi:MAG: phosphoenolpyruvate--protein phosphotransferase [Chloroflexota bacterium]